MIKLDYEFKLLVDHLFQELSFFYEEKTSKEIELFKQSDGFKSLSMLESEYQSVIKELELFKTTIPNIRITITNNFNSSYILKESPYLSPKILKIVDKHKFEWWVHTMMKPWFSHDNLIELAKQEPLENMGLELI
jgi:hypothetical protein